MVALAGCSWQLGYLASRWNRVESSMLAKAAELHRHQLVMNATVTALPAPGATDTTGQALTAKLGAALKVHSGLLASLDSTIQTGRTAVQEAIKTGKVGTSLKAMVDAQAAFEGAWHFSNTRNRPSARRSAS